MLGPTGGFCPASDRQCPQPREGGLIRGRRASRASHRAALMLSR